MKRKIFSILFALVLVLSFSLMTAVPAAAQTSVGSFSRTYQTTMTSTDFYLAIGLAAPVYFTPPWPPGAEPVLVGDPAIGWAPTYNLFHGMTPGAFLFEDIQFGSSDEGQTFTISSVSDDPDFDDFAAFLTNGTDDNIWEAWIWPIDGSGAGGIRCAGGLSGFFFESDVFSGIDVGTDFPGWTIQSVSLTFDDIYTVHSGDFDWLKMDYTVDIYAGPPTTPMSSFVIDHAKIDFKKKADDGKVRVKGKLALDANGEVDISEDVTVTVGPLSETILGGAMVEKDGKWECKDVGIIKKMKIDWNKGKFDFSMDKVDLSGLTDPSAVTISIQIGNDVGSTSISMTETKHWDYKAPK